MSSSNSEIDQKELLYQNFKELSLVDKAKIEIGTINLKREMIRSKIEDESGNFKNLEKNNKDLLDLIKINPINNLSNRLKHLNPLKLRKHKMFHSLIKCAV